MKFTQSIQRSSKIRTELACGEHCSGEPTQVLHLTQEPCNRPEADTKTSVLNSQLNLTEPSKQQNQQKKTKQSKQRGKKKKENLFPSNLIWGSYHTERQVPTLTRLEIKLPVACSIKSPLTFYIIKINFFQGNEGLLRRMKSLDSVCLDRRKREKECVA